MDMGDHSKDADQLCSNCTADQHFCFCCTDSTTSLLVKLKIPNFYPFSETAFVSDLVGNTED